MPEDNDEDEWDDDDPYETASDEIERAMQDCGQTEIPGFCWHAGTEHCDFRCIFRESLKRG